MIYEWRDLSLTDYSASSGDELSYEPIKELLVNDRIWEMLQSRMKMNLAKGIQYVVDFRQNNTPLITYFEPNGKSEVAGYINAASCMRLLDSQRYFSLDSSEQSQAYTLLQAHIDFCEDNINSERVNNKANHGRYLAYKKLLFPKKLEASEVFPFEGALSAYAPGDIALLYPEQWDKYLAAHTAFEEGLWKSIIDDPSKSNNLLLTDTSAAAAAINMNFYDSLYRELADSARYIRNVLPGRFETIRPTCKTLWPKFSDIAKREHGKALGEDPSRMLDFFYMARDMKVISAAEIVNAP